MTDSERIPGMSATARKERSGPRARRRVDEPVALRSVGRLFPTAWLAALGLLVACDRRPPCPPGDLAPIEGAPAFAVVLSDYASSAVALLDAEGRVLTEAWLDSGTRATGIAQGLGGDVVLPAPFVPGALGVLERYNRDVLTIAALDGTSVVQIDVRGDDEGMRSGASTNPQDVLAIDEDHVLVSRFNPALGPGIGPLARGDDVALVGLAEGRVTGRIELGGDVALPAEGSSPMATAFARPAAMSMLQLGALRRVVVGLARLTAGFDRTGPGAVALLDPDARMAVGLVDLSPLTGCTSVGAVPDAPAQALVLCSGDAFADDDRRRGTSGLARLTLEADGAVVVGPIWRASEHGSEPTPSSGMVPLGGARALVVADPRGASDPLAGRDVLVEIDLEGGRSATIFEAEDAFVLGQGAFDPQTGMALVPDAAARRVHRVASRGGSTVLLDAVVLPTCRTLPPRQVARLTP